MNDRDDAVRRPPRQRGPRRNERRDRDREWHAALADRFARGEYTEGEIELLERGRKGVEMMVSDWDHPEWVPDERSN